eukprot:scaffold11800_cov27-Cyclotella_meneghiniana.AAC.4
MSDQCASCGKADANLKACTACKLVKYCGVECQVTHRPAHKKACKKKVRELFEQKLYAQPPRKEEECPICMILMPSSYAESVYMICCGKIICIGCRYCLPREHCPFCNTAARSQEEDFKVISERVEKYNDPEAMHLLAGYHRDGQNGLPVNQSKAFQLLQRSSELGCAEAHYSLGIAYKMGEGVEIDMKKAIHHYQIAAIMGSMFARHNLACIEFENRNYELAMKHFMIAASCGCKKSLHNIKIGFKNGHVTKEDFEKTLRDYQASCDETKSEQRDRAAAALKARAK